MKQLTQRNWQESIRMPETYSIKVRKLGGKAWKFLSANGGMNRLRIHAIEFKDKAAAEKKLAELSEMNGNDYEFKVQPFTGGAA